MFSKLEVLSSKGRAGGSNANSGCRATKSSDRGVIRPPAGLTTRNVLKAASRRRPPRCRNRRSPTAHGESRLAALRDLILAPPSSENTAISARRPPAGCRLPSIRWPATWSRYRAHSLARAARFVAATIEVVGKAALDDLGAQLEGLAGDPGLEPRTVVGDARRAASGPARKAGPWADPGVSFRQDRRRITFVGDHSRVRCPQPREKPRPLGIVDPPRLKVPAVLS